MSIITLLNQIKNGEIILPAIQRDFVWEQERILRLLDSIMRGYPIGIALLWETYSDIQYRPFVTDYRPDLVYKFSDNPAKKRLKLVLDGQQRLQSLFIALYGSYCDKELYFDVLSGIDSDDLAQEKFDFEFMTPKGLQKLEKSGRDNNDGPKHFIKTALLFGMRPQDRINLRKKLTKDLKLTEDAQQRLEMNLEQFQQVLTNDENILKILTVDENLPEDSPNRKSDVDILEIFVRVNQEGTPLSRSDLIFSMLKLNWKESAQDLPQFVAEINAGTSFDLDMDFVIRCLFAVSDLGTKFDLDILRRKKNMELLQSNFLKCCDAIRSSLDFIQKECWCTSSRALGSYNTIIPLAYYLFHSRNHEVPNDQISNVRKSIYLLGFGRSFSRYADSRPWRFIKRELKPLIGTGRSHFPLDRVAWWLNYWEAITSCDEKLLQSNPILALHVVQDLSGAKALYRRNVGEVDHIFPRSVLREKGYDEAQINHFANFWILAKGKNQNKSARAPAQYFKDVPDEELDRALIDRSMFDYKEFPEFINLRSRQMIEKVRTRLQFKDHDFE